MKNLQLNHRRALTRILDFVILTRGRGYAWVGISNFTDLPNYNHTFKELCAAGFVQLGATSVRMTPQGIRVAARNYSDFYGVTPVDAVTRINKPSRTFCALGAKA